MRLCRRAKDFVQIINEDGAVRLCSWLNDGGIIGHLTKNSLNEIYHSEEATLIQEMHANGDHSNCNPNQPKNRAAFAARFFDGDWSLRMRVKS